MKKSRVYWTKKDDSILVKLIQKSIKAHSYIRWIELEKAFQLLFESGKVSNNYTKSQCVKRWFNHLKDRKSAWNKHDSLKLIKLSKVLSLQWKIITAQFEDRNELEVYRRYEQLYERKVLNLLSKENLIYTSNHQILHTSNFVALISSVPYLDLNSEVIINTFSQNKKSKKEEILKYEVQSYSLILNQKPIKIDN